MKPKPIRSSIQRTAPYNLAPYEPADVSAIQALSRGEATADQQQRALRWIIEKASGTYEMQFYPGEEGRRNTDLSLGRQFVGQQLITLLKINVGELVRRKNNE